MAATIILDAGHGGRQLRREKNNKIYEESELLYLYQMKHV